MHNFQSKTSATPDSENIKYAQRMIITKILRGMDLEYTEQYSNWGLYISRRIAKKKKASIIFIRHFIVKVDICKCL